MTDQARTGLINTGDLLFLFVSGHYGLEVDLLTSERASRFVPYSRDASFWSLIGVSCFHSR